MSEEIKRISKQDAEAMTVEEILNCDLLTDEYKKQLLEKLGVKSKASELTIEQKNVLLTEWLYGLKVIYPQDYYANLKGKNADYWRERSECFNNNPVVVKGNKPLKTHSIESRPMPEFYNSPTSFALIAKAREKIVEKGWQQNFIVELYKLQQKHKGGFIHDDWELVNASPEIQADAIVNLILK